MSYRLAIFDFDGTLADSFPFFLSVFNQIADLHGFRRIDHSRVEQLRHYNMRQMMRHVGMPMWKLPLASRSFMELMKQNTDGIALFDGIADALRSMHDRGVKLAVVSSNSEYNVRKVLGAELSELVGLFDCGVSVFGKASRIRAALRHAQVTPGEAIYVGDQGTDAEAAHKVGVAFGAVHWGYAAIEALRRHAPDAEFELPASLLRIAVHAQHGSPPPRG
jgi:phosphoglycolate phosphatase